MLKLRAWLGLGLDFHESQCHSKKAASLVVDHYKVVPSRRTGLLELPVEVKSLPLAKRLNLIEPSLRPAEIAEALKPLSRPIETTISHRRPIEIDKHGRAVGVGRRKESTARAFVVEGTGEVLDLG